MKVQSLAVVGHVGPEFGAERWPRRMRWRRSRRLGSRPDYRYSDCLCGRNPTGLSAGALADAVGCPHNTLSTHVAILARAGLVNGKREGRTITYRADAAGTRALIAFWSWIAATDAPSCAACREPASKPTAAALPPRNKERNAKAGADTMTWTLTNLVIEIIAGIVGAHIISAAAKEHHFGAIGHTVAGAVGGALSGYFLQTLAATVVNSTGEVQQDANAVTQWLLQVLTGLAAGAIVTMAVGFAKHSVDQHRIGEKLSSACLTHIESVEWTTSSFITIRNAAHRATR